MLKKAVFDVNIVKQYKRSECFTLSKPICLIIIENIPIHFFKYFVALVHVFGLYVNLGLFFNQRDLIRATIHFYISFTVTELVLSLEFDVKFTLTGLILHESKFNLALQSVTLSLTWQYCYSQIM